MTWTEIQRAIDADDPGSIRVLFADGTFWNSKPEVLVKAAVRLRRLELHKEALWLLGEISRRDFSLPKEVEIRIKFLRADILLDTNEYREAIEMYTQILSSSADEVAYGNRALAYWECGEYQSALDDYLRAVELNPQNAIVLRGAGEMYLKLKRPNEAIDCLLRAIKVNPQYSAAYTALGVARYEIEDCVKAYKCFTKAVALDPTDLTALRGIEEIEEYFEL